MTQGRVFGSFFSIRYQLQWQWIKRPWHRMQQGKVKKTLL